MKSLSNRVLVALPIVTLLLNGCGERPATSSPLPGSGSSYVLSVTTSGLGAVTSSDAGINCGSDCSESYSGGTSVILAAVAASGSSFSGWSGSGISCPGTGTCTVTMSAARTVTAAFTTSGSGPWVAPIGIPLPTFGINESHAMYAGQLYDYNNDGIPEGAYKDAGNGPYTHYVDRTAANCTDGNNDSNYGTPGLPRCTIPGDNVNSPRPLKAGSVVELHGRYTRAHTSPTDLHFEGTAAKPIFIRGASLVDRARVTGAFDVVGSMYAIVENMLFADDDGNLSGGPCGSFGIADKNSQRYDSHHIALRHSDLSGNLSGCGGVFTGNYGIVPVSSYSDLVFWDNKVHDNGDWQASFDQDSHGFGVGAGVHHVWVVDNEMHHNSGDGIQINGGTGGQAYTHHIYVGRNTSHHNKQSGFWTKSAKDVIFSQNTAYTHRPSDSSNGAGLGYQHEPDRVWFLYNVIYDNNVGIQGSSTENLTATNFYFIGNLIHDIVPSGPVKPDDGFSDGQGINARGGVNRYFINNTIYNTSGGIACYYSGDACYTENNIISKMNGGGRHLLIERGVAISSMRNNLLYQPGGAPTINWGSTVYTGVAAFQSGTGKGQSSLQVDPLFVNATSNDFRLQSASLAKNAGLVSFVYATFQSLYGFSIAVDPNGATRPQGGAWDMGLYEQ